MCVLHNSLNQGNADGQAMLASTLIPQPYSMTHVPIEEDVNMSFGRFVYSKFRLDCDFLYYFNQLSCFRYS